MRFYKYHALGNDYLVFDPRDYPQGKPPEPRQIRVICHRNFGLGSDGILWGPMASKQADFGLRIFNPDGSEAEKSGNGLRIFARFLWDQGLVKTPHFTIETPGGVVEAEVKSGHRITRRDGRGELCQRQDPRGRAAARGAERAAADPGPHVHLLRRDHRQPALRHPAAGDLGRAGHELRPGHRGASEFPRRTNVQFMQVLDRANIRIEIWERGAGHTLASGSSASAASAVAHRLGLVDRQVTVHMPGGQLQIEIGPDYTHPPDRPGHQGGRGDDAPRAVRHQGLRRSEGGTGAAPRRIRRAHRRRARGPDPSTLLRVILSLSMDELAEWARPRSYESTAARSAAAQSCCALLRFQTTLFGWDPARVSEREPAARHPLTPDRRPPSAARPAEARRDVGSGDRPPEVALVVRHPPPITEKRKHGQSGHSAMARALPPASSKGRELPKIWRGIPPQAGRRNWRGSRSGRRKWRS